MFNLLIKNNANSLLVIVCGLLMCSGAMAQATAPPPAADAACEKKADAPQWLPCGPDRMLSATDLVTYLFKPGKTAKMLVTGVPSGRKLRADFYPGGKFEAGIAGGTNIGKEWKLEGAKLCRAYVGAQFGNGKFDCGNFELSAGNLFLIDGDGNKSPVTMIDFQ
jgi:hypothetical protein